MKPSSTTNTTTTTTTSSGPRPCCVCKEEKAIRDECMLFSEKGESQCLDTISAYKSCMAGFGFKI